jgi:SulP family sulfate permease
MMKVGTTHLPTLLMGLAAIAIMWSLRRWLPKLPGVLIAVLLTTITSWLIGFEQNMGGKVVGKIPEGLPSVSFPSLSLDGFRSLIQSAIVISLVGFMEAISIAKAMAAKTRQRIDRVAPCTRINLHPPERNSNVQGIVA